MDGYVIILGICQGLDKILNIGIVALACYEFYLLVKSATQLGKMKHKIDNLNNPKMKRGKSFRKKKGEIETQYDAPVKRWDDLEEFLKEYQEKMKTYTKFSMIIQLFTLLGILGTVAGLYVAMQDMNAAENLFDGVRFALSSTVLGIISAVVFKIFDILLAANYVSYIDEGIELYEKDYNINSSDAVHEIIERVLCAERSAKEEE